MALKYNSSSERGIDVNLNVTFSHVSKEFEITRKKNACGDILRE